MKRDLAALGAREFDILVIGGGAFGAAAAWDATLRGLSVAVIDQGDFGAGASAECFKMVHGGIRYLQHADFRRLRSSCAERSALLRIAPHLVSPLPIAIPTYGHGRSGKAFLAAGMLAYDLLTLDKNAGIRDPRRRISGMRLLSRNKTLELFPELEQRSLTGAAVFEDGQMYHAARLVLAFVSSAAERGAVAANHTEALRFLWQGRRVCGVRAVDRITGAEIDIRARLTLNAAGPWAEYLLEDGAHFEARPRGHFSRDACFLVDREPRSPYALAVPGWTRDTDAVVSRAARHLFAVPWHGLTLIGVWHRLFAERPDTAQVDEAELAAWMAEMNASYPALKLTREDVIYANCGLVPFGDVKTRSGDLSFGKESRYFDHSRQGVAGLVTVIGIRYTTARGDSATALDMLLEQMPGAPGRGATEKTALIGGDIEDFAALRSRARREVAQTISDATLDAWIHNHGTRYRALAEIARGPGEAVGLGLSAALAAEVTYAVREEMALRLEDVVLRRTDMGSGSHPGSAAIEQTARCMQVLLGWTDERRAAEVSLTESALHHHRAAMRRADAAQAQPPPRPDP